MNKASEMLVGLSFESREQVNERVRMAMTAGGMTYGPLQDYGRAG